MTCESTGLVRDGSDLTAALKDPVAPVVDVDASGCDIGVYYSPDSAADAADIHGRSTTASW